MKRKNKPFTYETMRDAYLAEEPRRNNYPGIKFVDKFFSGMEAKKIDSACIKAFYAWRRNAGAADPTILRNISPLKAAFKLALADRKIDPQDVPNFGRAPRLRASRPIYYARTIPRSAGLLAHTRSTALHVSLLDWLPRWRCPADHSRYGIRGRPRHVPSRGNN